MRLYAVFVVLANFSWAVDIQVVLPSPIYGYISKFGIPRAQEILQAERELTQSRNTSGVPAGLGQYPFQAGLIGEIIGIEGRTVCDGTLISANRVLTAAHCIFDGMNQVWRFTVVLGSVLLFSGGTRINSTDVAVHPNFNLMDNDVAIIRLPSRVSYTTKNTIAPVSLPTVSENFENFFGETATAVGFGLTRNGGVIQLGQVLNNVRLNVITNIACSILSFPLVIRPSQVCTSSFGGSICRGNSGGPLLVARNGRQILIGVSSFFSRLGCEANMPVVFSRVTSYLDFLNSNM